MNSLFSKLVLMFTFITSSTVIFAQTNTTDPLDIKIRLALREGDKIAPLLKDKSVDELSDITLLMVASACGDYNAVKFLIDDSIQTNVVHVGKGGIDYTIPKDKSTELDGLRETLGTAFEPLLSSYLDVRLQLGRYIRAESECGYTPLVYAVIGGWDNIVEYLIKETIKRASAEKAIEYINKKDCHGWNAILYSVSYKEQTSEDKKSARVNLFSTLVKNSADTKVKGTFKEGELDLIGIATKYEHLELIKYFRKSYTLVKGTGTKELVAMFFGDKQEITKSIKSALEIASKELKEELTAWEKEL